ncbi:Isopenicillin N synthase-like [Parasponia andersonii]|uniref:Isopenicillin N synthase-like n=1 Tax=Parasponia andersonii TaxID=3476 RepID=A0A2P5DLF1_PARAD|nr:Isopenicillin N synthase-like [Parasponia andersonii]
MKNIRKEAIEYMKRAAIVIKRLLRVLLQRMYVEEIDKEIEHMLMGAMRLNFNYYTKCLNPELAAGVGRHSTYQPSLSFSQTTPVGYMSDLKVIVGSMCHLSMVHL